jgi:hypothetical protein
MNRFKRYSLVVALLAGAANAVSAPASADVITFTGSGTYADVASGPETFSGSLVFDTTPGIITNANLITSSRGTFDTVYLDQIGAVLNFLYLINGATLQTSTEYFVLYLNTQATLVAGQSTTVFDGGGLSRIQDIPSSLSSGTSVQGTFVAPAVPELSTWAMLLIGFAGIGLAVYRRKRNFIMV